MGLLRALFTADARAACDPKAMTSRQPRRNPGLPCSTRDTPRRDGDAAKEAATRRGEREVRGKGGQAPSRRKSDEETEGQVRRRAVQTTKGGRARKERLTTGEETAAEATSESLEPERGEAVGREGGDAQIWPAPRR
ncbi:hypothetical protein BESB_062050 [Besnoitia besnoiti]|uniref:Uncharacterized protein n=1 Tax=Besnoitia besnoiti TaxID=94643 RepID=A0A2A9MA14_BESBE|nr:hypothetical protein BESB_062050 [Besnoitia besnoiti]PFH35318.1 hypothetical protein BESB_062050 [Besnoitia besnoiti]